MVSFQVTAFVGNSSISSIAQIEGKKFFMDTTRYIVAGAFIDGSGARVRRRVFLEIKDGLIRAIGPADALPTQDEPEIDDFAHCTIVPALVDCSVSLLQSPSVVEKVQVFPEKDDTAQRLTILDRHIHYCHAHGVQGIVDTDAIGELVQRYQKEKPWMGAMEIRSSGSMGSTEPDFLRINYSASIEDDDAQHSLISHEELCHTLKHRGNKKAVVLANGSQHVKEALEAGCDAIEQGYNMGDTNLRKMADRNVLWIPSIVRAKNGLDGASSGGSVCCRFSTRYVAPGKPIPGAEAFWKRILAEQLKQLSFAKELGLTLAVGTGGGSVGILHGESMVEEMKLFMKAGYSLEEAICCASENGARFFNMTNLGRLCVGRKATFLITRGSVKQLPRKLSYLEGIYINGQPSSTYQKHPVKAS